MLFLGKEEICCICIWNCSPVIIQAIDCKFAMEAASLSGAETTIKSCSLAQCWSVGHYLSNFVYLSTTWSTLQVFVPMYLYLRTFVRYFAQLYWVWAHKASATEWFIRFLGLSNGKWLTRSYTFRKICYATASANLF